jgi:hypothetical protein
MGYAMGDTAAAGVTELPRRQVLGRCMDANTMQALLGIAEAWHDLSEAAVCKSPMLPPAALCAAPMSWLWGQQQESGGVAAALAAAPPPRTVWGHLQAVCVVEELADKDEGISYTNPNERDPWNDGPLLQLLQTGDYPPDITQAERDRLAKRSQRYSWHDGRLIQAMNDGSSKIVVPPSEREEWIRRLHSQYGHLGVKRTLDLLYDSCNVWWRGMYADVANYIGGCGLCDRARASFAGQNKTLNPLPVKGMFYRWHIDLAGPFVESTVGSYTVDMSATFFELKAAVADWSGSGKARAQALVASVEPLRDQLDWVAAHDNWRLRRMLANELRGAVLDALGQFKLSSNAAFGRRGHGGPKPDQRRFRRMRAALAKQPRRKGQIGDIR